MFDPATLPDYIAGPVNWEADDFGTHTHVASYVDAEPYGVTA